jgi:hypothetical protein
VGASIMVGYERGEERDGYRKRLRDNLSCKYQVVPQRGHGTNGVLANDVVWAGTERSPKGDMEDGFFVSSASFENNQL